MGKHLDDKAIEDIVELLDDWPVDGKLTWDRLVDSVDQSLKIKTTRQTLEKQARIKQAFKEVKAIISGSTAKSKRKSVPPSLKIAQQRLEKNEREIERLKSENNLLLVQFHTWLYNANNAGITVEQLNNPLPFKE